MKTYRAIHVCMLVLLVVGCDVMPSAPDALPPRPSFAKGLVGGQGDDSEPSEKALEKLARFHQVPVTPEHVSASIGPEGGSLSLGDFEIIVPPGAVAHQTHFKIRRPMARKVREFVLAELHPHNVTFMVPIIVRFPLSGTDADPDQASVGVWERDDWTAVTSAEIEGGARFEARVTHFSYWGVLRGAEISSGGVRPDIEEMVNTSSRSRVRAINPVRTLRP